MVIEICNNRRRLERCDDVVFQEGCGCPLEVEKDKEMNSLESPERNMMLLTFWF